MHTRRAGSIEQFQSRAMRILGRYEARVFGAEHELVLFAVLVTYPQAVTVFLDGYHHAHF